MAVDDVRLNRLAALLARTESPEEEEARTAALLAVRLMKSLGLLPANLMALVQRLNNSKSPANRISKAGGIALAKKLTAEQRSNSARNAANARWRKRILGVGAKP